MDLVQIQAHLINNRAHNEQHGHDPNDEAGQVEAVVFQEVEPTPDPAHAPIKADALSSCWMFQYFLHLLTIARPVFVMLMLHFDPPSFCLLL